jgi:hypothetical protein
MPEHRIRFRGGWESSVADGDHGGASRLILPVVWPPGIVGPIRLTRRFGRPPIDPTVESVWLELSGVPGLQSLRINGVELGMPRAGVIDWTVRLESLEARNTLTLAVDLGQVLAEERLGGWGSIALLITPKRQEGD